MKRISGPGAAIADYALVTTSDVREFLGNTTATDNETELGHILENVQRQFADELGGRIIKNTGTDYDYLLDIYRSDRIYLPHYPIVSISRLEWVTMAGGGTYTTLQTFDSSTYEIDADSGTIMAVTLGFPVGPNAIRCTWKAGYDIVPAAIRDAICQWAAVRYQRVYGMRLDKLSEAHEADSTSYTRLDRPDAVQRVIDQYKYWEATVG